jgi:dihydroflavonol-4-reductase
MVRFAALWDVRVRATLSELGKVKNATSEKAQRVLEWSPRSREEALLATAESLRKLGLVSSSSPK